MPITHLNGVDIYYELHGEPDASPLLIIPGLTDATLKCGWQTEALADDFHVIVLDNRGAGRSTQPTPGYTVVDMAADAAALLEHLGLSQVNVFGFSLGGMIALNLAVRRPDLVGRLALGCTTAGGDLWYSPEDRVMANLVSPPTTGDRVQDYLNGVWMSCSNAFVEEHPETIQALMELGSRYPQTADGYAGQMQAVLAHDVVRDLAGLKMPVLVMHGDADLMIPLENGLALARAVPDAELILYPGAGHLFFIEEAAAVNEDLRAFFTERWS